MRVLLKWDFFRILRFSMGLFFIIQAFFEKNIWTGLFGLLFAGMAWFNVGCCSGGACGVPSTETKNISNEITYEEVNRKV